MFGFKSVLVGCQWVAKRSITRPQGAVSLSSTVLATTNKSGVSRSLFRVMSNRFQNFATMLSPEDRTKALSRLDSWKDVEDGRNAISRSYEFENFQQAWSFMSEIAKVADKMDHHPEWFNVYNRVDVTLTTHDCSGVSQKVSKTKYVSKNLFSLLTS